MEATRAEYRALLRFINFSVPTRIPQARNGAQEVEPAARLVPAVAGGRPLIRGWEAAEVGSDHIPRWARTAAERVAKIAKKI